MTDTRVRADVALLVWAVAASVLLVVAGFGWWLDDDTGDQWPARVYRVCEQYAGLDLSGLAPLCVDAGYQERVYLQPTGAPAYWPPPAVRTMQPEDLN